ncbi:MAG: penicillin-binding transpeptidase domain-containing protein [Ilumatobacteraceae bacterium]
MAADKRAARLGVLALVAALLFGVVGVRLWFLQTVQADSLQQTVDARKTKVVPLVPERGRIFDADGRIVAGNERVLTAAVDWDVISRDTDRAELFTRLSGWLEVPVDEMEARYDAGVYSRYLPLPLKEGVSEDVAIAIGERGEDFPGVSIVEGWRRVYPYAPLASHVVGYMGAITAEDQQHYQDLGYDTSVEGEKVGRSGVELSMEETLHGKWGQAVYEVDANNRIVREISFEAPVNGMDVQLSIDLDLQQYAERLLQTQLRLKRLPGFAVPNPEVEKPDGTRGPLDPTKAVGQRVPYKAPAGSVIVMNNQTGQISAMASYPTFDNRWFDSGVGSAKFDQIFPRQGPNGEELDPDLSALTNRAIQGQYNMGSSFKPFTAYAALATGRLGPNTTYNDQGTYKLTSIADDVCAQGVRCVFRNSTCPNPPGEPCRYGTVNVTTALAVSSDTFFYKLGEEFYNTPGTQLQDNVRLFGFGADTGIDLPFEFDGRVPTDELKAQLVEDSVLAQGETKNLQPGDLLQMAIGQGLMAATPLQLAVGYSALANGGHVMTPRVVQAIYAPETPDGLPGFADLTQATLVQSIAPITRDIPMSPELRDPIDAGLRRNILGPGTNDHSTTAEELFADYPAGAIPVAGKTGTAQGRGNYPWNDSSAFAAYSEDPEQPYTVVSYLEKSGFGSTGAAPVVKCMFLALSGITPLDPVVVSEPLDTTSEVPAESLPNVGTECMASTNAGTIRPQD